MSVVVFFAAKNTPASNTYLVISAPVKAHFILPLAIREGLDARCNEGQASDYQLSPLLVSKSEGNDCGLILAH